MSQPDQPGPQGGISIERSMLDPNITNQVQGAFGSTLTGLQDQTKNLPGQMQYSGMYNPTPLNLQSSVSQMSASPFEYSKTLDPLVQNQLSAAQQETSQALGAKNDQISESLRRAPGNNQALISSLQADNSREASLASNPYRQNALVAQRGMDTEKYGMNLNAMNANNASALNAGNFANQSALSGRNAEQSAFTTNAGIMGQNNQARLSALSPQMQQLSMLGQGMISTAPRVNGNFTMDDIQRIKDNPDLVNTALQSGLITQQQLDQAGVVTNAPGANDYNKIQNDYIATLKRQNQMLQGGDPFRRIQASMGIGGMA